MAYRALGEKPSMRAYGNWSLTLAGLFNSRIREVKEVLYQFRDPFVVDTSKFEDAFEDPVPLGRSPWSFRGGLRVPTTEPLCAHSRCASQGCRFLSD